MKQEKSFLQTYNLPVWAHFWEPGTGKSKIVIDTAVAAYDRGDIDLLMIISSKPVCLEWELTHFPEHLSGDYTLYRYDSLKKSAAQVRKRSDLLESPAHENLKVFITNYETLLNNRMVDYISRLCKTHKVFVVLDESTKIKSPTAKRTKRVLSLFNNVVWKRILTGTPVTKNPLDAFTQILFLDPNFWRSMGFNSYYQFKNYFAIQETQFLRYRGGQRQIKVIKGFKNLELLRDRLTSISDRVIKDSTFPEKVYERKYYQMSAVEMKHFKDMTTDLRTKINETDFAFATNGLAQMSKLMQIMSGYVHDNEGRVIRLGETSSRLEALKHIIEEDILETDQVIIWSCFTEPINMICEMLGDDCVRYDGLVPSSDERAKAVSDFREGKARFFVANQAAAGEGLNLQNAKVAIYFNNSYKLGDRLQSEDRCHRIGSKGEVRYIDLICEGGPDIDILDNLNNKKDISGFLLGDFLK